MRRVVAAAKRHLLLTTALIVGAMAIVLSLTGLSGLARWLMVVTVAAVIVWTAVGMVRDMLKGRFGLDVLALIAMVATLLVGEYAASLIIVIMLTGGDALEDYAQARAMHELTALRERSPLTAHRISNGGVISDVPVGEVRVGDELLIRPSETMPVDALIVEGSAEFDESSLTGESVPVHRGVGDRVPSGAVNGSSALTVRALHTADASQFQQIVALVHEAQQSRAPVVRLADRFALPFTAVSLAIAGAAWAVSGDPVRFAQVLVLATPCPLLIAAPVAFLGGMSRAAKEGIIVKGGAVLEGLGRVRAAAFDKTGTLTQGRPRLVRVEPSGEFNEHTVLALAASAEQYSSHVLAEGIRLAALERGMTLHPSDPGHEAHEAATNGVRARITGRDVAVGKPAYIQSLAPDTQRVQLHSGEQAAYVAIDGMYAGALILADAVRAESAEVIAELRTLGVQHTVMLTGDVEATASGVARQVGIDTVHAELLPPQKVALAAALRPRPVMMVGDGVNDAPVLAAADVGIALAARGSTVAGEAADAVILNDSLTHVVRAVRIGQHTLQVAYTAIWVGIVLSVGLMLVATTGVIPAVVGAITQEFVDVAAILFALRALTAPRGERRTRATSRVSP